MIGFDQNNKYHIYIYFRFDNSVQKKVVELVFYHDAEIAVGKKFAKRWLNRIGLEQFQRLLTLKKVLYLSFATVYGNFLLVVRIGFF